MTLVATFDQFQGFSNRIKNIVSCYRMSENVEIMWDSVVSKHRNQIDISILDYFPNLVLTDTIEGKQTRIGWRLEVFDDDLPDNFEEDENIAKSICSSNGKGIDFEYQRIPQKVKDSYVDCFKKLNINPKILELVDSFSQKEFETDTISVHIRSWFDCGQRKQMFYNIQKFFDIMDQYQYGKFFIAIDDQSILPEIKNRYGENRIITYPYPNEYIGFVDQLLLSKNYELIASPTSTFSEVAWWFSECKSNVKVAWNY